MIHTVKGFSVVDEAEKDVFLKFPCFLYKPVNDGIWISRSSSFSKPSLDVWKFLVHIMLKPSMQDFKHGLTNIGSVQLSSVTQSCLTLYDPRDYTVNGILQTRIQEWVVFPFSRVSFQPRDRTQVSLLQADSLPAEPPAKRVRALFWMKLWHKGMLWLVWSSLQTNLSPYQQ